MLISLAETNQIVFAYLIFCAEFLSSLFCSDFYIALESKFSVGS